MTGNLTDIVRRAARSSPGGVAILTDNRTWTWREIDAAADSGAAALRKLDLRPGDRLVVSLPVGAGLAAALIAAVRADLVVAPVDPHRSDLGAVVDRVGAAAVIVADQLTSGRPAPVVLSAVDVAGWFDTTAEPVEPQRGGEDIAILARATKAGQVVMVSHRAVLAAVEAIVAVPELAPRMSDRVLQVLPLFHLAGLVTVFLPACAVGAGLVLTEEPPATPDQLGTGAWTRFGAAVLASVRRHRVTVLPGSAPLYRLLLRSADLEASLTSVRVLTSAASPLHRADAIAVKERIGQPVWEGYGITESCSVVCSSLMTPTPSTGSVGTPLRGVEVRIEPADDVAEDAADASDSLASVDADADPGRICVRGPQMFSGYWPGGTDGPDADGWFATSDVGYLDADGELHLIDRLPETLIVAGFTVYPREVENALLSHPLVRDVAVVGVQRAAGTELVATVVHSGTEPTAAQLDEHLEPLLPAFKRPTRYRAAPVLPRTELGRLDRATVATEWADHLGLDMDDEHEEFGAKLSVVPGGQTKQPAEAQEVVEPPEVMEVNALDRLGSRLPGVSGRSRRSAQDTDSDLFDEDLISTPPAEPAP